MYIKEFTIYGFGQWIDQTITLDQSFTCIYGRNESGKTTIQQFILFMLFGLPPRKRKFHRPKTSGRLGGRLTMIDSQVGEYVIERQDGQNNGAAICYTRDGQTYDEQWLQKRLKGYTRKTYESVYSFSADDLVDLSLLDPQEVGHVLLSMSLTGSQAIHQIEGDMKRRLNTLFRPQGKNPTINKQLSKLDELHFKKSGELKTNISYEHKRNEKAKVKTSIKELQAEKQLLVKRQDLLTKQNRALPYIKELIEVEETIKKLPEKPTFPEKGIDRYEHLKEKKIPLQSKGNIVNNDLKEHKRTIEKIHDQLIDKSLILKGEEIIRSYSIYEEREEQIKQEKTNIKEMNNRLANQIDKLQINLDESMINGIDFSFQTKSTWQKLKNTDEQIKMELDHHAATKRTLSENQRTNDAKLVELADQLMPDEQLLKLHEQADAEEQKTLQTKAKERQLFTTQSKINKYNKRKRLLMISTLSITALLVIAAFILNHSILYLTSFISLLFGFGYIYITKESIDNFKEIINELGKDQTGYKRSSKYHYLLQQIDEAQRVREHYNSLLEQQRTIEVDLIKWQEKQKTLMNRRDQLVTRLEFEIEQYPFLKFIDVTYWLDLYYEIQQIKTNYGKTLDLEKTIVQLERKNKNLEEAIDQLLDRLKIFDESLSYEERLQRIEKIVHEQKSLKQTLEQSEITKENLLKTARDLTTKIQTIDESINELFYKAEVTNEEQYYYQFSLVDQLKVAKENKHKLQRQLAMIFGTDEWQTTIQEPLSKIMIEKEQVKINKKINAIKQSLEEQRQNQANLSAQMEQIEHSNAYSETFHQFSMEQNELNEMAKEWALLKTAEQMLKRAKYSYKQQYLDNVLQQTMHFFKQITKGRYNKILMDEEINQLILQSRDLIQYEVAELSKGTVDQLYISLRLAMSQIVSESAPLPFLIDDALVHSDHDRKKRMLHILQDISKHQQVLLFTCHPENITGLNPDNIRRLDNKSSLS